LGLISSIAVAGGAALGALLRWVLGLTLNPVFPTIPLGTLTANLLGGFLMGVAVHYFASHANASPELRLALTTGFLGGFTTFSTFSAEAVDLISRRLYGWSLALVGTHVVGSILLTVVGLEAARLVLWRR
jgi:CrcB protein